MHQLVFDPSKVMDISITERTGYHAELEAVRASRRTLKELAYTPSLPDKGYNNRTLYVNVDTLEVQ